MKKFLAFTYSEYYPEGGWGDFIGPFEVEELAEKTVKDWILKNEDGAGDVINLDNGIRKKFVLNRQGEMTVSILHG